MLDLIARNVITTQISVLGSDQPWNKASSYTILIYIFPWNDDITRAELNVMVKDVYSISHEKHLPKLLLIMDSNERTFNARRQLEYLWALKFPDVIILEASLRSKYSEPVFVAVHQFNGFNKSYMRLTTYDGSIDWHSNSRNIYGGTFKVSFNEMQSPYGSLEPENGAVSGLAKVFSTALSSILNGTVIHTDSVNESNMMYKTEVMYHHRNNTDYDFSVAVDDDRICLLIPILPAEVSNSCPIVVMILIGTLLTVILWCASTILRVSERVRDPLNTVSLLLGISPFHRPRTLVEKVLFFTIVITAAEYMAQFQARMFAIEFLGEKRVSSFEDLSATGLQVMAENMVYDELVANDDLPSGLMGRFTSVEKEERTSMNTSRAYFKTEMEGKLLEMATLDHKGERLFKVSDLCIMSQSRVHTMPLKSLFKNEINQALLKLVDYGFVKKHKKDFFWKNITKNENKIIGSDHSINIAFLVILVGYTISLVAFIGELVAGQVAKRKSLFRAKCLSNPE
ncbi:hypothetical protein EAG_14641 [Camponotus floridanus]|uniref:Ionotropic glutamate receptor C-terminal domain-containing protein n=1 Tax=Camponotus floridanus TaxID=104421 RepID=E2ANT5_CAMFO|nr:hypothetical protein EAG_14641 [Camponotus floridanus]